MQAVDREQSSQYKIHHDDSISGCRHADTTYRGHVAGEPCDDLTSGFWLSQIRSALTPVVNRIRHACQSSTHILIDFTSEFDPPGRIFRNRRHPPFPSDG